MNKYATHIDQKLLSAFVAAAETGSFLQAGNQLNKSKSTISRWMKELEDILGYELFHKRPNGSMAGIKNNGRLLLPKTKSIMLSYNRLEEFSFSLKRMHEPTSVKLAFKELIPTDVIADISLHIKDFYPNIEINVVHADLYDIEDVLLKSRADFVLGLQSTSIPVGLRGCVVGDVQTMFIAHPEHHLAKENNIDSLMLASETMIYPSCFGNNQEEQYACISASETILVTDYSMSLSLAEKGIGIAYVPDHIVRSSLLSHSVVALDVNNNEFNNIHSIMLYCRENCIDMNIYKIIIDTLKEWFGY